MPTQMKQRAANIDQIIRQSERFPRIRDAEREMAENEEAFLKRREKKRKQAERLQRQQALALPEIKSLHSKQTPAKQDDYFSSFVINSDPSVAKYMLFNEVHYPKLFSPISSKAPHTIDSLWMLGFAHESTKPQQTFAKPTLTTKADA